MGDKRHILVIDDDISLAGFMSELLDNFGYQVTTLNDSLEARQHYMDSGDQYDLVITDQTMPGMTGVELASAMLEKDPDQAILLCTGYSDQVDEQRAHALGIKGFLQKPMETKTLLAEIERLLGE